MFNSHYYTCFSLLRGDVHFCWSATLKTTRGKVFLSLRLYTISERTTDIIVHFSISPKFIICFSTFAVRLSCYSTVELFHDYRILIHTVQPDHLIQLLYYHFFFFFIITFGFKLENISHYHTSFSLFWGMRVNPQCWKRAEKFVIIATQYLNVHCQLILSFVSRYHLNVSYE